MAAGLEPQIKATQGAMDHFRLLALVAVVAVQAQLVTIASIQMLEMEVTGLVHL
jgi:hypothetical protein